MKTILALSTLFCAMVLPTFGELTVEDLEKIQQMFKASETALTSRIDKVESNLTSRIDKVESNLTLRIDKVESKIEGLDTRLRAVEAGVAELRGRSLGFGTLRDWIVTISAFGALIVSIFVYVKTQSKTTQTPQDTQKVASQ